MKTISIAVPSGWRDLKPHPLSTLVEFGAGIDIAALAGHMRRHGYDDNESIILYEGQILDGRHKHIAAQEADAVPTFREFVGPSPAAYVAKKLHRQHLNTSQRSILASRMANITGGRPKETASIEAVSQTGGRPKETASIEAVSQTGGRPKETASIEAVSQTAAAAVMNVSRTSVQRATVVEEKGSEELRHAVMTGGLAVSTAAQVIEKPQIFCRQCRVGVPKPGCKECKKIRAERDGTYVPPATTKKRQGKPLFDWHELDKHFSYVARWPDMIVRAYPKEKGCTDFKEAMKLLGKLADLKKFWFIRLTK